MGKLSELFRWKKEVVLKDHNDKELTKVYMRIIGDYDLQEAYRLARIASAKKRERLKDMDSTDYQDQILPLDSASEEEAVSLIKLARNSQWVSLAYANVVRPDEIKLSEVAIDADAPTLEEQEKLDRLNLEQDAKYEETISEYVRQKEIETDAELAPLTLQEKRVLAQVEASILLPLTVFLEELQDQKVWRSVYEDKEYTKHAFESIDDYREMFSIFREQLVQAYKELETELDTIKN